MSFERQTEKESHYRDLEKMSSLEILQCIHTEDRKVADIVAKAIPQIEKLVEVVADKMLAGGRLFYIGAGTSGRLGIVDASECPPTYGIAQGLVVGLIAGGDSAIRKAVEFAEDDRGRAFLDLKAHQVTEKDVVVGIAASGTTPYVLGGLSDCRAHGICTACICCNPDSPIAAVADYPIEVVTGPEFVSGSTRMKAGTAQKMVLNMLSTAVMIRLGRVKGNKMVDMQLSNDKLIERGVRMISEASGLSMEESERLLAEHKSVRKAIEAGLKKT